MKPSWTELRSNRGDQNEFDIAPPVGVPTFPGSERGMGLPGLPHPSRVDRVPPITERPADLRSGANKAKAPWNPHRTHLA